MFNFFKKIKSINKDHKKKGITLVIAVTTMTLLLSISLSISNIVLRQIKITTTTNNSKTVFFAADSAAECAFYFDTLSIASTTDSTYDINSDYVTAIFGNDPNTSLITDNVKCGNGIFLKSKITNGDVTTTVFDIDYGDDCANISLDRKEVDTTITARGYNTKFIPGVGCDLSNIDSRRLVERGLTIKY